MVSLLNRTGTMNGKRDNDRKSRRNQTATLIQNHAEKTESGGLYPPEIRRKGKGRKGHRHGMPEKGTMNEKKGTMTGKAGETRPLR